MKRFILLILALVLVFPFTACKNDISGKADDTTVKPTTQLEIKIASLSGTTGMGFAKLCSDSKNGTAAQKYSINFVADATAVSSEIVAETVDIAAVPTNLASTLYKKTNGGVKIIAVNTLGVLYLLENGNSVNSIADLRGKTVFVPGKGTNPEYILQYIVEAAGLKPGTDISFDYTYATPDELANAAAAGLTQISLLPEPKVTIVKSKNKDLRTALGLTDEWEKTVGKNTLAQGCLVARTEFIEAHRTELAAFLTEYKKSVEYTVSNPNEAAAMIEAAGIIPKAAIALAALPNCNITYIDGEAMKTSMTKFYETLFSIEPKSIGGALPDDAIYYIS